MGNRYADHVTPLYPQKLALTSPTGGSRSVGIVRSRAEATEFSFIAAVELAELCPRRKSNITSMRATEINCRFVRNGSEVPQLHGQVARLSQIQPHHYV